MLRELKIDFIQFTHLELYALCNELKTRFDIQEDGVNFLSGFELKKTILKLAQFHSTHGRDTKYLSIHSSKIGCEAEG